MLTRQKYVLSQSTTPFVRPSPGHSSMWRAQETTDSHRKPQTLGEKPQSRPVNFQGKVNQQRRRGAAKGWGPGLWCSHGRMFPSATGISRPPPPFGVRQRFGGDWRGVVYSRGPYYWSFWLRESLPGKYMKCKITDIFFTDRRWFWELLR